MNITIPLDNELVPRETLAISTRGFAEKMVIRLLETMSRGGMRLEYPDGRVRHFGEPGAPVTARVFLRDDETFFKRCAFYGNIGMGEAYTDGLWDTDDIAAVVSWFIHNVNALQGASTSSSELPGVNLLKLVNWFRHLRRENSVATSRRNIAEHYDLGNDFYRHYGCRVTGVTISEAQAAYARQRVSAERLDDRVEIRIQDYRHITGRFDKIASIEMLEAVGDKYHHSFFAKCAEVLTPDGLLGLQMITVPDCSYRSLRENVDWIQKHIFPGSLLLSVGRINEVLLKTGDLFMHDLEDLGADYARTLSEWHKRFNSALPAVRELGFDEPFVRSWNYYLKYCEAAFATRNISVVQAVYTRPNNRCLDHVS